MRTIHKYSIPVFRSGAVIWLPKHAEPLHVAEQTIGELTLWAVVDPDAALEERRVRVVGTGHPMPEGAWKHIGTVLMHDGLVLHVFLGMTTAELIAEAI